MQFVEANRFFGPLCGRDNGEQLEKDIGTKRLAVRNLQTASLYIPSRHSSPALSSAASSANSAQARSNVSSTLSMPVPSSLEKGITSHGCT